MKKIYSVCFFGHRNIENHSLVYERLESLIAEIIEKNDYVDFLVGRSGDFDQIAASSVRKENRRLERANSSLILILPYMTAEYRANTNSYEEYYDEIEIFPANTCHFKAAFQIRNQYIIDRSDLCIFYVEKKSGGAYTALKYAEKRGKQFINIFDTNKNEPF